MHIKLIHILFLAIVLCGCSTTKKTADSTANQSDTLSNKEPQIEVLDEPEAKQPIINESIADAKVLRTSLDVSGCMVVATIISIDETLDTGNPSRPCGQVPCGALIRIDKVVRMGQQCAPYVVVGAEIRAYFKITLSKTEKLFPDMKQHFPGLDKSDTFATTFVTTASMSSEKYQIVINGYKKSE